MIFKVLRCFPRFPHCRVFSRAHTSRKGKCKQSTHEQRPRRQLHHTRTRAPAPPCSRQQQQHEQQCNVHLRHGSNKRVGTAGSKFRFHTLCTAILEPLRAKQRALVDFTTPRHIFGGENAHLTWAYSRLLGLTRAYLGLFGLTRGFWGGRCAPYSGLLGLTRAYSGLPGLTRAYSGSKFNWSKPAHHSKPQQIDQ